jgi:hypothetical protein
MAFSKQDRKLKAKLLRQEFLGESHHILSARQMEKRKKKSNTSFDSSLYFGLLKYLSPAYYARFARAEKKIPFYPECTNRTFYTKGAQRNFYQRNISWAVDG